jgi:hypothetical protein
METNMTAWKHPGVPDPRQLGLEQRLERIEAILLELLGHAKNPAEIRSNYTIEEVSEILGVTPNTIRIWCRHGRINAKKRSEKRGGVELWSISAAEITRYRDEGLLPLDPGRNSGRFEMVTTASPRSGRFSFDKEASDDGSPGSS